MALARNICCWLIVLGLLTGCSGKKDGSGDDKPADGKKDAAKDGKTGDGNKGSDLTTAKPDFILTPQQYAQEENASIDATLKKYQNKVVEMSGVVSKVGKSKLMLSDGSRVGLILCFTREPQPWKKATPGQTVKLRGKGARGGAAIAECEIIEVTGPGSPKLTAEELAKELVADEKATKKKYDHKYLIVSGEIASIVDGKVTFKTSVPKPVVTISFPRVLYDAEIQALKKGEQFTALGEFTDIVADMERIELLDGLPWK